MFSMRLPEKGACTPETAGLFTVKTDSYTEHSPTSRIDSKQDRRSLLTGCAGIPVKQRFFEGPHFFPCLRNGHREGVYTRENKAIHGIIPEFMPSDVYSNNGIDGQLLVFKPIVKKLCGVKKRMRSCLGLRPSR